MRVDYQIQVLKLGMLGGQSRVSIGSTVHEPDWENEVWEDETEHDVTVDMEEESDEDLDGQEPANDAFSAAKQPEGGIKEQASA